MGEEVGRAANRSVRGTGYVSRVSPALRGEGRSNPPDYPTPDKGDAGKFDIVLPVKVCGNIDFRARCQGVPLAGEMRRYAVQGMYNDHE